MRLTKLLLLSFLISYLNGISQTTLPRIEIVQPTVAQEATSIWRTINDYAFFEKQGYHIKLPKDPLIDSLIIKSKKGSFGNEDFPVIYALVEDKVFDQENYKQATQKVKNQLCLLNDFISEIGAKKRQWDWEFNMFDPYQIVFTRYGTGGSYDPDKGVITLLTNKEGDFVKYKNPAYTIIHEIVHMGIEYSIVNKFKLPHGLKERIVDTLVYLMFQEKLPGYKIQNMGDQTIDTYLKSKKDIKSLNSILSRLIDK